MESDPVSNDVDQKTDNKVLSSQSTNDGENAAAVTKTPFEFGTRFERIGEMNCLFLSCYQNGKFPICNIGPSRGPMVFLIIFAGFCFGYCVVLVKAFAPYNHLTAAISCFSLIINLIIFFMAMCKDPGIEDVIYEHYFKTRYGHKIDGDEEEEDIENLVQDGCYDNSDFTD